ncbi:ATP-dependent zinc metalloprotease FtsH [Marinobacter lutaoensis]|jgi:cell division protease FtsH|uniref:ATP-dependent zinc metalloprotease FtsH n=1 Tax=Marinobacter lutaoensis TaxID=135739 RepID=A0A1V2DT54_9GAMM|nr:ATP-dependent zinc metalloprotease FtsH [Marinobacter lutaoensis]MBE01772.1 cell division protein FtsH [Marinobacter sp.]MBI42042.1 cell division protein FtsH [Oceanospirillales bacterium]NVD36208.1 ATP-dependent zinc metalloprotease FtsH [Marinobacter lutaoensis]ONF43914.1 cell division protein FtsH [Marinobacter lutaoensis]
MTTAPGPGQKPDNPPTPPQSTLPNQYAFLWLSAAIFLMVLWMQGDNQARQQDLAYSDFKAAVVKQQVAEVTLKAEEILGKFTEAGAAAFSGDRSDARPATGFRTIRPPMDDPELLPLLEDHGITIRAAPAGLPWWQQLIQAFLPWLLLLALMFWFWNTAQRRMGQGGGLFDYARSRARRARKETSHTTLDDVAGIESAKREITEIIEFLKSPERFRRLGAVMPKGILLVGPPGTGKTLLARAIAGEADVPFFSISASEFIEMFVGVGAARVRDMFQTARKEAPALIFIDELDAIGRSRGTGLGGGHDEREQTLNQILTEMDGFEEHESILVLAATNRPDVLDSALLRPGRFDRKITLDRPHKEAREAILAVHVRKVPLAEDVNLSDIAARTIGFSGADLKNLVNEAALTAVRSNKDKVDAQCFDEARDRIILGEERDAKLTPQEREAVAYHECGHAIMAYFMPKADPLTKVTIIPHGMAMGVTEQTPQEDRYTYTESYLKDRIKVMLGGRSAEKVIYGEVSTGAQNDLKEATRLLRRMIGQWGMSEKVGPLGLSIGEEHVFLGREMGAPREFSEKMAELIDAEIQQQLIELERETVEFLKAHRNHLEALAREVLQKETLSAEEIDEILRREDDRKIA